MAFLIYTIDKAGSEAVRDANRQQHYEFLQKHAHRLIASGGLLEDDESKFVGAAILLDCATREDAEAFVAEDPFTAAGLFETVHIVRWRKAFFDGKRVTG